METPLITLSELQQRDVWEGWLSSEILAHYFGDLVCRFQTRQRRLTLLTLVFSSAAFATIVGNDWLPPFLAWFKPVSALIAAFTSAVSVVERYDQRAVECSDLYSGWSLLANQFQDLWDDMYSSDAPAKLRALQEKTRELSRIGTKMPENKRLLLRWQDYIEKRHNLPRAA